jgi:hypothetical protein
LFKASLSRSLSLSLTQKVFQDKVLTAKAVRKKKAKQKRNIQSALAALDDNLGQNPINNYEALQQADANNPHMQIAPASASATSVSSSSSTSMPPPSLMPSAPTPIDRTNPHLNVLASAQQADMESETMRKPFSELDESERERRRSRASAVMGIKYEKGLPDFKD